MKTVVIAPVQREAEALVSVLMSSVVPSETGECIKKGGSVMLTLSGS